MAGMNGMTRVISGMLLALAGCGGEKRLADVPYKDLGYDNELFVLKGKPFNGSTVDTYKNGAKKMVAEVTNGKFHGWTREWYEDGTHKTATQWHNGERHGANTYWYPDGRLMKEMVYNHGKVVTEKHF